MKPLTIILSSVLALFSLRAQPADSLLKNFEKPPAEARPWVYWFWNNGNVTSNGITADLEAMQRVGIGGVLIMDVLERFAPPQGTAEFMNPEWQNLFEFSVQEAARLGLEINMANGPGWCGSSGPWITPELSMQKIVSASTVVSGPANFSAVLPQPNTGSAKKGHDLLDSSVKYKNYYEDIAVLAIPQTADGIVQRSGVVDLTAKLDADGKLNWAVPAGNWIIQRIGHTTTGSSTRPPVVGGNGLECDKLSAAAMDAHFAGQMAKLINTAGPLAGKSLVATHIDSWEVGAQNWTPKMREEFQKRRGYDLLPWLPCLTDAGADKKHPVVIGDAAMTARFRWDFDQTRAELLAENYSGRMEKLAQASGLRYSLEGYDLPFGDEFTYTARADEPMTEFWTGNKFTADYTDARAQQMASVAHVYGRVIVGAESFTSGDKEMWKATPADIKALGDFEFCMGVNRFVVHRYAHQPYLDRAPGATMGPWGLHYERTQTWWEMSGAWHAYLSCCQYLLRQGKFAADLLYLRPEAPNQTWKSFAPNPPSPAGYRYDEISGEALMERVSVADGKFVLPDGMSYRVLVLPPTKTMSSALLEKIRKLATAGATIVVTGPRPQTSPSLTGFPQCDETVAKTAGEIWGDCDGKLVTEHAFGKGRVVWGRPLEQVLAELGAPADFTADAKLNWIHRRVDGAEIYFVANPSKATVETRCTFRVNGLRPELWNPETGETTLLAAFENTAARITVPLRFGPSESAFIVFRQSARGFDPVVKFLRNGEPLSASKSSDMKIISASYGVPGDAARTRNVREQVQALVNEGKTTFQVAELAETGDPAYGVVKTLTVEYLAAGKTCKATGQDPDNLALNAPAASSPELPAGMICDAAGQLHLAAREPGSYEWITASGRTNRAEVSDVPSPLEIAGPWQLTFPPKWGAPESVTLTNLISWTDSADDGVKYFSGTATYRTTFDLPNSKFKTQNSKLFLTLGDVRVMARVKVNGQDCGIAWHPPFRVEITGAVRAGANTLEIQVANLWPNRMIGDSALPVEKRFTWSSWEPFKPNTPLLPSGLLGPVKIFCN